MSLSATKRSLNLFEEDSKCGFVVILLLNTKLYNICSTEIFSHWNQHWNLIFSLRFTR